VHAARAYGERDIGAGIDQQTGAWFPLSRFPQGILFDHLHRRARESFEFASGQVFFTQLDVVHTTACRLSDFLEHTFAAEGFRAAKLGTIADVVEKQAAIPPSVVWQFYGFVFAISGTVSAARFGSTR
jgi:hypothetical protein